MRRLWRSTSGLSGIEFAFIAPLLVAMLLGTVDICNALICRERVINLASSVSGLVAMTSSVSSTDISNAYSAGNAIMYPFSSTNITIVISSITYSATTQQDTVAWSRSQNGTPLTQGSVVTVPAGVIATMDGASTILVSVSYDYTPPFASFIANIPIADQFYSRPRESLSVACNGC